MFGDPLQRFAAGDGLGTIRADTLNALVDSAKLVRQRLSKGVTGGVPRRPSPRPGALEVLVQNDTGGTLAEWSVVELLVPLVDATVAPIENQERPAFSAIAPTDGRSSVAVLAEPIPDGAVGRAVVMGVAVANLDVIDAAHKYCGPTAGETGYLTTAPAGPIRVLWAESGTGNKLGVVLLQAVGTAAAGVCGGECGAAPALPAAACLRFSSASGWATCLPATLPLRLEQVGTDGCGWRYVAAAGGAMAADCLGSPVVVAVCGRPTAVAVTLTCDGGDWKLVYTGSDAAGVTGGRPLDGTLTSAAVTSATFAADGSLSLGTITIGGSSAVTVELAWGSECLDCGCDGPPGLPADACLLVDDKTGTATCAPDVVTLALAAGGRYAPSGGSLVSAVECSGDVGGGNGGTATVCGQETFLGVAVTCAVGGGYLVTYTGVGYAGAPPADGNPLAGGIQVVVPCDTFDAAFGTVDLGTLTTTGGSVRLLLAWGDSCSVPPGDCPAPCDLTLTYDWDDGLGDTGTGTLTVPFTEYTGGLATWEGTFTTRCGTSFVWTITCDAEGDTALVVYDGVTPVLEATFAESAGVWTGTITTACGDLTALSFEGDCTPPPPPPTCPPWCDAVVRYDYSVGGYTGSSGFSIPFDTYDSGTQTTTWAGSASTPCGLLWVVITCDDAGAVSLIGYDSGGTAVLEVTFTQAAPNEWTGTIVTDCGGAFTAVTLLAGCSPGGGGGALTPGGIVAGGVV